MTDLLLFLVAAALASVAVVLFRGFSGLQLRFNEAIRAAHAPMIAVASDVEDMTMLANVGSGTAVDVAWSASPSGQSGSLPYLAPRQTHHFRLTPMNDRISITYRALSGESFSTTIEAATIAGCGGRLTTT